MKKRIYFLLLQLLLTAFFITGCRQQVSIDEKVNGVEEGSTENGLGQQSVVKAVEENTVSEESMSPDFYYIIEDTFSVVDRNDLVVVGINENSELHIGAEVDILSATGRIQTQVLEIEIYEEGLVDSVETNSYAGVMLAGVTKEQVNIGDILVLRDQGFITDEADALVVLMASNADQVFTELSEGQNVQVILYDRPIDATITFIETISEEEDGNLVSVSLKFAETIACQNYQMMAIRDENDNSVAAGRFVFSQE